MSHEDFTPIGKIARTQAEENPLAVGNSVGLGGAAELPPATVAAWLAARKPQAVDSEILSRLRQRGVDLRIKMQGRFPENGPSYEVASGWEIHGDKDVIKSQIEGLNRMMSPAPIRQIESWLAELSVIVAGRGREGIDAELMLTAYSSRLSRYPADIVREALIGRSWKWFPTWAELETACNVLVGPRQFMLHALMAGPAEPEPVFRPPTEAEKQRMADLIAERFPQISAKWREAALAEAMKGDCIKDDPK